MTLVVSTEQGTVTVPDGLEVLINVGIARVTVGGVASVGLSSSWFVSETSAAFKPL